MVDASDLAALLLMKERGLLKPFKSPAMDAVAKELRDPDGTWITDRLTQAVIQFNTKEFGSTPPVDLGRSRQGRHERPPGILLQSPTATARRASTRWPSISAGTW